MQRIMVVDDDLDILFIVAFLLEQEAFSVMQVADCKKAIPVALDFKPDLIICDINLGMCDGRKVCYELKTSHKLNIPIILFSANKEQAHHFSNFKADGFIEKPFDATELVNTIQSHLHHI